MFAWPGSPPPLLSGIEIACIHAGFSNLPQSTFDSSGSFVNGISPVSTGISLVSTAFVSFLAHFIQKTGHIGEERWVCGQQERFEG